MILKEIINFLDSEIPKNLALSSDQIGFQNDYDLNMEIDSIKIYMDLTHEDDEYLENTLIITHHPPLFAPKTPTYTIHSNWDIVDGGANDALAEMLKLNVADYFDDKTKIGRICSTTHTFFQLKKLISDNFKNSRIVNPLDNNCKLDNIAVISGFGLKNPDYIHLAKNKKIDILISGDLTQESAILAKNLEITLIDLGHHESEVPGLYKLKHLIDKIDVECEVINKSPIEKI